jgi:hypothetical protein
MPVVRTAMLGLALWASASVAGCREGSAPDTPERKEKQGVVQDKMKEFMQKSKLPNRAR